MRAVTDDDICRLDLVENHRAVRRARNGCDAVREVDRGRASEVRRRAARVSHSRAERSDRAGAAEGEVVRAAVGRHGVAGRVLGCDRQVVALAGGRRCRRSREHEVIESSRSEGDLCHGRARRRPGTPHRGHGVAIGTGSEPAVGTGQHRRGRGRGRAVAARIAAVPLDVVGNRSGGGRADATPGERGRSRSGRTAECRSAERSSIGVTGAVSVRGEVGLGVRGRHERRHQRGQPEEPPSSRSGSGRCAHEWALPLKVKAKLLPLQTSWRVGRLRKVICGAWGALVSVTVP